MDIPNDEIMTFLLNILFKLGTRYTDKQYMQDYSGSILEQRDFKNSSTYIFGLHFLQNKYLNDEKSSNDYFQYLNIFYEFIIIYQDLIEISWYSSLPFTA